MTNYNSEILDKLDGNYNNYVILKNKYNKLLDQQIRILLNTIDKYNPIMKWYKMNKVNFMHYSLPFQTTSGPILGYNKEENRAIIYDLEKKLIITMRDTYPRDVKHYPYYQLILDGFFIESIKSLKYLEDNFSKDIKLLKENIEIASCNLEKVKSIL
ncbi:hypothetical protein [Paucisalibacillus globulus]|uniref:hypothetical protein n=1 Tax=Paucisalibacillus globulus TaxID=351095 RepID=UPI000BB6CEAE|nr:hypothetical protein [Paucisalibacillus globulus]